MTSRIRKLTQQELEQARMDGLTVLVMNELYPNSEERCYGVLEYSYGEESAEGPSWAPVEIL
jgi:hypothetical protein